MAILEVQSLNLYGLHCKNDSWSHNEAEFEYALLNPKCFTKGKTFPSLPFPQNK